MRFEEPQPGDDRDVRMLDAEHLLEPIEDASADIPAGAPVVRDVRGRLWRIRPRPAKRVSSTALTLAVMTMGLFLALAYLIAAGS